MNTQINPTTGVHVEVFGPTVEFLTSPDEAHLDFCVMRGVIPPGVSIPLHSHPDTEDFIVLSGEVEALRQGLQGYEWVVVKAGDHVHVPSNVRHAWRNVGAEPNIALMITTPRLGRFFQEVGRSVPGTPQPVSPEELAHFLRVAAAYDHWNATPDENAAVGIRF